MWFWLSSEALRSLQMLPDSSETPRRFQMMFPEARRCFKMLPEALKSFQELSGVSRSSQKVPIFDLVGEHLPQTPKHKERSSSR